MKKLLGIVVLGLLFCNITLAQSLLPKCEGSDNKISEFSLEHYKQTRKWTKCQGTGMGPRGEKYVGEWQEGKFHGQGTFIHEGRKYIGEWKKGKKYGQGTYTYANGDKYVGEWIKSKYGENGPPKITYKSLTNIFSQGQKWRNYWA